MNSWELKSSEKSTPQPTGGVGLVIDVSGKLAVALKIKFPVTPVFNPGHTGNCSTATIQTAITTVARDSKNPANEVLTNPKISKQSRWHRKTSGITDNSYCRAKTTARTRSRYHQEIPGDTDNRSRCKNQIPGDHQKSEQ